jgi:hypothetical protein
MVRKPASVPSGMPVGHLAHGKTSSPDVAPPPAEAIADANELVMQIERAHPGYRVWISDAGWWYATRTQPWACGRAATVHGPGPGELSGAIAEEEAAKTGRAMSGAW